MKSIRTKYYVFFILSLLVAFSNKAFANINSAEKALAQLLSDVDVIKFSTKAAKEQPTHYKTKYGDTLDQIIIDYLPNLPIRTATLKRAIIHANPHAFKRSNPNWMYSGKKLKLPDANDLRDLIFTDAGQRDMFRSKDRDGWIRFP